MKTNAIYESLAPKGLFAFGQLCMGSFNGYTVTLRPYNGRNYYLDVAVRPDSGDRALVKRVKSDRKSTRLNSSHSGESRMPSSA